MPTGYTADVATGDVTTLREFALRCARGMGALITMRDEPSSAPVPKALSPSSYHSDKIAELTAKRNEIQAMSLHDALLAIAAETEQVRKDNADYAEKHVAQRQRYSDMIHQTEAWSGAPEGLKEFMLDQLGESLRFDCRGEPYQQPIPLQDPTDWRQAQVDRLTSEIIYHQKQDAEEIERTGARNAWLAQLWASLPPANEQTP